MKTLATILFVLVTMPFVVCLPLCAQPAPKGPRAIPTANDALALALADAKTLPGDAAFFSRYVWIKDAEADRAKAISFASNATSRAAVITRPAPFGNDALLLLRLDLRAYAPRVNDLKEWLAAWEELQFEPAYSLLITKGTLASAAQAFPDFAGRGWVRRERAVVREVPGTIKDGKALPATKVTERVRTSQMEDVTLANLKDIELVRLTAPHIDQRNMAELVALTNSQAPIVTDGYLLFRMLSALKEKGTIFEQIWSGLYYEFAGIKTDAKRAKGTDLDVILEDLGIGNVQQGVTAEKIFEGLRSDSRVAMFRSGITGNARRIDFIPTLSSRLADGGGFVAITHDLATGDVDVDQHPVLNLLDFKDKAREGIARKTNGLHEYFLTNGAGLRQDSAPENVARDHTVPPPHASILQPAIGCISCHEAEGSDGWRKVTNDVPKLLKNGLDIFGDVGKDEQNKAIADTIDRLAGLYSGDPERILATGRDNYAAAVLKATGAWKGDESNVGVVKRTATKVVQMHREYSLDLVTPAIALREAAGIDPGDADATALLNQLLPPDRRAGSLSEVGSLIPEDVRIGALKAGIPISRWDFSFVRPFISERIEAGKRRELAKGGGK